MSRHEISPLIKMHRSSHPHEDMMNPTSRWLVAVVALLGLSAAAYFWMQRKPEAEPTPPPAAAVLSPPVAQPATKPAPQPTIRYPIEAITLDKPAPAPTTPPSDPQTEVQRSLMDLIGRKAMLTYLSQGDFIRQFVTTVDNLAQGHTASMLWPVSPTPGKTLVKEKTDGLYLDAANAKRFEPFVRFATSFDVAKATALYVRLYPWCQKVYEELGYPGKYFNDRLVDVIDQLLQTPELTQPVKLTLTEVSGPIPALQPWMRYEFADPDLETRPAGQKILLRMGSANAAQIKAKLSEFRTSIAKQLPSRPGAH